MSEPEELILEGAHFATRVARDAWRRYGPQPAGAAVPLARVRARLELFASALFETPIAIAAMEPPAPVTWLARLARSRPVERPDGTPAAGTDGRRVLLPPSLDFGRGEEEVIAVYRLLAVEGAARLVRNTPAVLRSIADPAVRDLFQLAEAVAVDRWIAAQAPGLADTIRLARRDALARRTPVRDAGNDVEQHIRAVLAADPRENLFGLDAGRSPEACLAWARATARSRGPASRYRPAAAVWYWGRVLEPARIPSLPGMAGEPTVPAERRPRVTDMRRTPRPRQAGDGEDDEQPGTWVIRADDPQESVEDPFGLQRPADKDENADPEGLADSLSDLPEARVVRTPGQTHEILRGADQIERVAAGAPQAPAVRALTYPEWDWRLGQYREPGAVVRQSAPALGDPAWVAEALARHGRLARRVRARFERLRPRPMRLNRQVDGSEVDIAAYVTAAADVRAGTAVDGRMYVDIRHARRELGVALLLDVSASTDAWISTGRRIVDVEKEALLVVCEALDALGDRYGIFAFSGEGADDVAVLTLKSFSDRLDLTVQRRIAALDADRYTRLGAPVRHVTAALGREPAPRRLLLILSDGKPNDVDVYEGRYGVEDTRQAVAEARRQGIAVFCLTVDREAPRYASRIFGSSGFAVLDRPEQLPAVLIEVLRQLIRI